MKFGAPGIPTCIGGEDDESLLLLILVTRSKLAKTPIFTGLSCEGPWATWSVGEDEERFNDHGTKEAFVKMLPSSVTSFIEI